MNAASAETAPRGSRSPAAADRRGAAGKPGDPWLRFVLRGDHQGRYAVPCQQDASAGMVGMSVVC